ncbi:hypothetical protein WDH52_09595 [Streptomyces sp. TRM70308]|uniref:hypothetical protein n=1 Tax=Streptomyces sp. TRM70308 TaxID=3131932 RepID=UPI003CFC723B
MFVYRTPRTVRRLLSALTVPAAVCWLLLGAAPAAAGERTEGAVAEGAVDDRRAVLASYLAERFAADPVHVSDSVPYVLPGSAAPRLAEVTARVAAPVYVAVLPREVLSARELGRPEQLLASVYDRSGARGLYVLLHDGGVRGAAAFGLDLRPRDVERALRSAEAPPGAGPLVALDRSVEAFLEHFPGLAAPGSAGPVLPEPRSAPERTDGRLTALGLLAGGLPLLVLFVGPRYRHRWPLVRERHGGWLLPVAAAGTAAAVLLPAQALYGANRADHLAALAAHEEHTALLRPPPGEQDLARRVARVADGLRERAVYQDPEYPAFTPAYAGELAERLAELPYPARLVVLPSVSEDETRGDEQLFVERVAAHLERTGGRGEGVLYVHLDPHSRYLDVHDLDSGAAGKATHPPPYVEDPRPVDPGGTREVASLPERADWLVEHLARVGTGEAWPYSPAHVPEPADASPIPEEHLVDRTSFRAFAALGAAAALGVSVLLSVRYPVRPAAGSGRRGPDAADSGAPARGKTRGRP